METEIMYSELIDIIKEIVVKNSIKETELNTVLLVGSNHHIKTVDEARNRDSDIDIIVLSEVDAFQIHTVHNGVKFDISIVNQNEIINLILTAVNGSPMAGKIFSSSSKKTIIRDKKGVGVFFINIVEKIYSIFNQACLPNYKANHMFLHNIAANLSDTRKQNPSESFFAYHRLSNHLFDYISKLIYPFYTSGSYRGKVFEKYLTDFQERIFENTYDNVNTMVVYYRNKFSPIFQSDYEAVVYSSALEKEILSSNIVSFYFGIDNPISESTVIFLPKEELLKNKNRVSYKLLELYSIIPFLSQDQLDVYNSFLVTISKEYLSLDVNERKFVLSLIINRFEEEGFGRVILESLKAILIIKTSQEISKENIFIGLEGFKEWMLELDIVLPSVKQNNDVPENIEYTLSILFEYINCSDFTKEKEIKVGYMFFGIMSALRIQIADLDL
ncbi:hypothetical protein D1815_15580 [Aquimarina sp. AD1]|uniref:hypothetical protein n=2 Tax=Aquimarina sp. (strain AD1) TaxID=1714848 RepID=UPI000E54E114|nr:hypothetical protein [Aquimarina sp. AD1]AXT57097.1 hypothetical protein D1815_15580 [Aquimarina sp. AD1]